MEIGYRVISNHEVLVSVCDGGKRMTETVVKLHGDVTPEEFADELTHQVDGSEKIVEADEQDILTVLGQEKAAYGRIRFERFGTGFRALDKPDWLKANFDERAFMFARGGFESLSELAGPLAQTASLLKSAGNVLFTAEQAAGEDHISIGVLTA